MCAIQGYCRVIKQHALLKVSGFTVKAVVTTTSNSVAVGCGSVVALQRAFKHAAQLLRLECTDLQLCLATLLLPKLPSGTNSIWTTYFDAKVAIAHSRDLYCPMRRHVRPSPVGAYFDPVMQLCREKLHSKDAATSATLSEKHDKHADWHTVTWAGKPLIVPTPHWQGYKGYLHYRCEYPLVVLMQRVQQVHHRDVLYLMCIGCIQYRLDSI